MDLKNTGITESPSEGRSWDIWDCLLLGYFLLLAVVPHLTAGFSRSVPSPALLQSPDVWWLLTIGLLFLFLAALYFFTIVRRPSTRWGLENFKKPKGAISPYHLGFLLILLLSMASGPPILGSVIPTVSNFLTVSPAATLQYKFQGCRQTRSGVRCSISSIDENGNAYSIVGATLPFLAKAGLSHGQRFMVTGELSALGHRFESYDPTTVPPPIKVPTLLDQKCVNGFREFRGSFYRCTQQEEASR